MLHMNDTLEVSKSGMQASAIAPIVCVRRDTAIASQGKAVRFIDTDALTFGDVDAAD